MKNMIVLKNIMGKKKKEMVKPKTDFQAALVYCSSQKGYGFQSWLSRKIGLSQQYIHLLISGKRSGDENTRRIIADALGYEYDEFLKMGKFIRLGFSPEQIRKNRAEESNDQMERLIKRIDDLEKQLNYVIGVLQGMGIRDINISIEEKRKRAR